MVSIKLKFKASSKAGKEGSLYYQVIYNRMVGQITTPYMIFPEEWNHDIEELIIKHPSSRLKYLKSINRTICCDIERIHRIVRGWVDDGKSFTIDELVEAFHKQSSCNTLFSYMERMITLYWRQGQYRTSETYATTLNSFKRFRSNIDIGLYEMDSMIIESYESSLKHSNLSQNTISFNLKHLRAVYNRAVDEELTIDRKPFKRVSPARSDLQSDRFEY